MRTTSVEVYRQIKEEGLLGAMQMHAYSILFHHGPMTQSELEEAATRIPDEEGNKLTHRQVKCLHQRFSELERRGVIAPVENRNCRITGREVMAWQVTAALPTTIVKKVPLKKQLAEALKEIASLKQRLADLTPEQSELPMPPGMLSACEYAEKATREFIIKKRPLSVVLNETFQMVIAASRLAEAVRCVDNPASPK